MKRFNLVNLLSEKNNGLIDDSEAEHSYAFPHISVGIWREAWEKDLEEWIMEKKENGKYEQDREWIEEEVEVKKAVNEAVNEAAGTAYFYLDSPVDGLPALTSAADRCKGMPQ